MAGELPAQEPDEKPGPGAGVGLMGWRDLDMLGVVAGVPVRAAALFPHGSVAPRPEKNDSPRSQSGFFNRLAEGDLVGALHDGDAVGIERMAQDVARPRDAEGFREGGDFGLLAAGGNDPAAAAERGQPCGEIVADAFSAPAAPACDPLEKGESGKAQSHRGCKDDCGMPCPAGQGSTLTINGT